MTGRPNHRPTCWPRAYTHAHRIDRAAETLTGIAVSLGLIAACALIRAAQAADDAWREFWEAFGELGCIDLPEDEP